jgi:hypothetical protein
MRRKGTDGKKIRQGGKKRKIKKLTRGSHLSVGDSTFTVPEPNRKYVHPIPFRPNKVWSSLVSKTRDRTVLPHLDAQPNDPL